ncbi:DNA replication complex GINS protein PSF1 [Quillaja saponaria]|uniref:DNA replication complex GINS protein PSF1 n=1 Tax=Quillaja saponaria TaxID=32244 RepID=A0AAD7LRR2_QUISA|nr:DNA replication complex GINS protein PSF1 [Quillaja saponaria]
MKFVNEYRFSRDIAGFEGYSTIGLSRIWKMYGRKACQLVKELASGEKGLTPFNSDLFDQVIGECSQHHLELQSLVSTYQASNHKK